MQNIKNFRDKYRKNTFATCFFFKYLPDCEYRASFHSRNVSELKGKVAWAPILTKACTLTRGIL